MTEAAQPKRWKRPLDVINGERPAGEHSYRVNEIVVSIQGEGARMGIPTVFLRFSQCDLTCSFCDTAHQKGEYLNLADLMARIDALGPKVVSLCGGEPTLQVDTPLMEALKGAGYFVGIETHGGNPVHEMIDWVTVSPKVANRVMAAALAGVKVDELKYVVEVGQPLPQPAVEADHYFISAIYDWDEKIQANMDHARDLVMGAPADGPQWKLTLQAHKTWGFI